MGRSPFAEHDRDLARRAHVPEEAAPPHDFRQGPPPGAATYDWGQVLKLASLRNLEIQDLTP